MKKNIGIYGSTGSIGSSTVDIILKNRDSFSVKFLTSNQNYKLLAKQAIILEPDFVVIADERYEQKLKSLIEHKPNIKVLSGYDGVKQVSNEVQCDLVVAAIIGAAGLEPLINSIKNGSDIAIANKECFVCAGELVISLAKKYNVRLIPIDSEHNAIMQIFDYNNVQTIDSLTLTASGGPFLDLDIGKMHNITVSDALNHPKWSMGKKITIDSATMFNKAFEVIEAHYLFNINIDQIKIVVHPQSLVHSFVNYKNGSTLAQISANDMRIPISIALFWPEKKSVGINNLDLSKIGSLDFRALDEQKFPAVKIARESFYQGKNSMVVLNAANEVAVNSFLDNRVAFLNIYDICIRMIEQIPNEDIDTLEQILYWDNVTREIAKKYIEKG